MTISLPPTAPSRQDPATFSDRADAFASWLVGAVPQFNALAVGSNDSGNFQHITVSGQITGNAVTQSSTDTTAGRLLKVGDYGNGNVSPFIEDAGVTDASIVPSYYRYTSSSIGGPPGVDFGILSHRRRQSSGGETQILIADAPGPVRGNTYVRARTTGDWPSWRRIYDTGNTTVDSNGFVKEASPIVRLFDDGTQEPVQPVGAQFERLGVGEYRLSDVEPLAETGWQIEVPQDGNGNRLVFVATEYDPEARTLTIITSEPAWDGGWVAGEPKDIPDGRWVDLRFKPLPKPEEEGDA